jgi:hypothetical protein
MTAPSGMTVGRLAHGIRGKIAGGGLETIPALLQTGGLNELNCVYGNNL